MSLWICLLQTCGFLRQITLNDGLETTPSPCLKYTLSEAEHISHWLVCWLVKVLVLLFDKSQRDHLLTLMSPAKMQCSQWELKLFGCQHSSKYKLVCEMF